MTDAKTLPPLLSLAEQSANGLDSDEASAREYPWVIRDQYGIAERFATRAPADLHLGEGFGALGLTVEYQNTPGLMSRRLDLP